MPFPQRSNIGNSARDNNTRQIGQKRDSALGCVHLNVDSNNASYTHVCCKKVVVTAQQGKALDWDYHSTSGASLTLPISP